MAVAAGARLGPYEVATKIGAGGMGEVYRARDTHLGRDVAIKVLPATVAQDADRLARFDREARTLAALNHPNIAQITVGGGSGPRWLPDGRGLVYTDGARLWQIDANPDGTLDASRARELPGGRYMLDGGDVDRENYGVGPDGRVVVPVIERPEEQPTVVWNWLEALRQRRSTR